MYFCKKCGKFKLTFWCNWYEGIGKVCDDCNFNDLVEYLYEWIIGKKEIIELVIDFLDRNNGEINNNEFNEFHTLLVNKLEDDIAPYALRNAILKVYDKYKEERGN